ncbi:MAG: radical SAM protein [Desulfobacteraceae bacterium]|nr:MAG: radical SAM protein [Desulfobacteraceae bacterium]
MVMGGEISVKNNIHKYYANRWVCSSPYFFIRMMRGFINAHFFKKNTLRVVELFPTFNCQLKCTMCSVSKYNDNSRKQLDLNDYGRIARNAAKLGANTLSLLGGEPLLYNQLEELISIFHKEHYYIAISTNGYRVTKEKLDDLKASGLDAVCFSLESVSKEINDSILGEGHYERTMKNIELAKKAGVRVFVGTVVFPGRVDVAHGVFQYCHSNNLNASVNALAPVGNAEKYSQLSNDEFSRLREIIATYPKVTADWAFSYFLKQRCPGGKEKIGITCYGDVTACSYLPITFGNIYEEPLQAIWSRMENFSQFKKDFPGCLAAGDGFFRKEYLKPTYDFPTHPVSYTKLPNIYNEYKKS